MLRTAVPSLGLTKAGNMKKIFVVAVLASFTAPAQASNQQTSIAQPVAIASTVQAQKVEATGHGQCPARQHGTHGHAD